MSENQGLTPNDKATALLKAGQAQVQGIIKQTATLPSAAPAQAQAVVKANPNITAGLASSAAMLPNLDPRNPAFMKIALQDRMIAQAKAGGAAVAQAQQKDDNGIAFWLIQKAMSAPGANTIGKFLGIPEKIFSAPAKLTGTYDELKGATRVTLGTAMLPYEAVIGHFRNFGNMISQKQYKKAFKTLVGIANPLIGMGIGGFDELKYAHKNALDQTHLGQLINATVADSSNVDTGSGYFISGTVAEKQRQAAIDTYKSQGGQGWTLGRGLADSLQMSPDSYWYSAVSGIVDAVASFLLDPTIIAGKATAAAKLGKTAAETGEILKTAKAIELYPEVKALKQELLDMSNSVTSAKIADASARAENAKAIVSGREDLLAQLDPAVAERQARIADLEAQRLEVADELKVTTDSTIAGNLKVSLDELDVAIAAEKKGLAPLVENQQRYQSLLDLALTEYADELRAAEAGSLLTKEGEVVADKLGRSLEFLAGINRDPQGAAAAYDSFAEFIGGKYASPLVEHLVNSTDPIKIWRDLRMKLPIQAAERLAIAANREEVLQVLAPFTGTKITGPLGVSAAARVEAGIGSPLTKLLPRHAREVYAKGKDKIRSLNDFLPNGQEYHIDDVDGLARAIVSYGKAFRLPSEKVDGLLKEFMAADDYAVKAYVASGRLFNTVFEHAAEGLNDFQKTALQKATRIFDGGATGMSKYWASRHATGSHIEYVFGPDGKMVRLSGPHLESELLNSTVFLPAPDQIKRTMSLLSKTKTLAQATSTANALLDGLRTSKLLRPAHTIRNNGEMQWSIFLTGHSGFLNNPLALTAMVMGNPKGPAFKKFLARVERFDEDAMGRAFKHVATPEDEALAADVIDEFVAFTSSKLSSFDQRAARITSLNGVTPVEFGHEKFFIGVASELRKLGFDGVARVLAGRTPPEVKKAIAKGATWEDAVVEYFYTGAGKKYMDLRVSAQPEAADLFRTYDGIKTFLFGPDGVMLRLNEATGNIPELKALVAKGAIEVNGKPLILGKGVDGFENLAKQLKGLYGKNENFKGVTVNVRLRDTILDRDNVFANNLSHARQAVEWWFTVNRGIEMNTAMSPLWRQVYWDEIAKLSGSLDGTAALKLQKNAQKSLLGLRIGKVTLGENSRVYKTVMNAKGNGPLTLEAAHAMASERAGKYVSRAFYDAYNRKSYFHALRHVIWFGQAWWDTLERWSRLGRQNPVQVYKAAKVWQGTEGEDSNFLYDTRIPFTNIRAVSTYDPDQGFMFTDPKTGKRRFFFPFAGSLLAGIYEQSLAGKMSGIDFAGGHPFEIMSDPMSLNMAMGTGNPAPPVGFGISFPVSMLPENWVDSGLPDWARNWIFPFGRKADIYGPLESTLLPPFAQKLVPLFSKGGNADKALVSTVRPTMDYLLSTGAYDLKDAEDANRLIADSMKFAKWFGAMTGLLQWVSPSSPLKAGLAQYVTKEGNVDYVLQQGIYSAMQTRIDETGDYYGSVQEVLDTFGVGNVLAMVTGSKGGIYPRTEAFDFLQENPKLAAEYENVFGYFFPNGEFSQAYWNWQQRRGLNESLTAQQVAQQGRYLLYMAAKNQLDIKEAAGTISSAEHDKLIEGLVEEFGERPTRVRVGLDARVGNKTAYLISEIRKALKEPEFASTPTGQATIFYLQLRDQALADAKAAGYKSLNNKASAENRAWLRESAQAIDEYYGGSFMQMFQGVFENEVRD